MSIEVVRTLEQGLATAWETYIGLHKQLDPYAGKDLKDFSQEEIDKLNGILSNIQDTFTHEIYPALNFAIQKADWAKNAITGFNNFIQNLKDSGAKEASSSPANGVEQPANQQVN